MRVPDDKPATIWTAEHYRQCYGAVPLRPVMHRYGQLGPIRSDLHGTPAARLPIPGYMRVVILVPNFQLIGDIVN
jgi:hypothetical protein